MAVKIKLKRLGKIRAPYYRIVIADSRTKRDGRAIEEIGKYHPKAEPSFIEVNSERAQHWLAVGAQPTDPVRKILEITGDWQKFKGLPGSEGTLRMAEPKADRKDVFAAAVAETLTESGAKAKPKGKTDAKSGDAKAGGKAGAEKAAAGDKPAAAKAPAKAKKAAEEAAAPAAADTAPADTATADTVTEDAATADTATADTATADTATEDAASADTATEDAAAPAEAAPAEAEAAAAPDADGA